MRNNKRDAYIIIYRQAQGEGVHSKYAIALVRAAGAGSPSLVWYDEVQQLESEHFLGLRRATLSEVLTLGRVPVYASRRWAVAVKQDLEQARDRYLKLQSTAKGDDKVAAVEWLRLKGRFEVIKVKIDNDEAQPHTFHKDALIPAPTLE